MKKFVIAALGLFMFSTVTACTPSPEKVCNHMMEMAEKEASKDKDKANEMTKERKENSLKKCIEKLEEEKKKDSKKYECEAKCTMDIKDWNRDKIQDCDKKCGTK